MHFSSTPTNNRHSNDLEATARNRINVTRRMESREQMFCSGGIVDDFVLDE